MNQRLVVTRRVWRGEAGMVLPLTLMILVVLATVCAALLGIGGSEVQIASNAARRTRALFAADGGVERAVREFVANPSLVTNATTAPVTLITSEAVGALGTYSVTYRSVGPATVLVSSTGQTTTGAGQQTVEAVVTTNFVADYALLGDGSVKVKKASHVKGARGSIHDNWKTEVKCDALCVEGAATSSTKDCKGCTNPQYVGQPGSSGGNHPVVRLPQVKPTDFLDEADYMLGDDGKITDSVGTVLYDDKGDKKKVGWHGWTMGGHGEWINDGDSPPNGTYYASKRIRITGNLGAPGAPWRATLIAGSAKNKGTVDIRGDAVMEPSTPGVLIVAGKVRIKWKKVDEDEIDAEDKTADDKVKLDDDDDDKKNDADEAKEDDDAEAAEATKVRPRNYVDLTGMIIATSHKDKDKGKGTGRVKLSGDVRLKGNVVAQGRIEIKGSTVTYDGSGAILAGDVRVIAWGIRAQ